MPLLPIESVSYDLCQKIQQNDCILIAPPGAGKSTYLPLQLLALDRFSQQTIIMLQPRQVAARSIAQFLCSQLQEPMGKTIGYQVRGDSKIGPSTRLVIMTEGMLSARMQSDPELEGVGLVIFDEFHERSIHSDIAFGLALEVQQGLRDDLRLLVMSATLQIEGLKRLLPNAHLIECEGRAFPIEYKYRPITNIRTNAPRQSQSLYKKSLLQVAVVKVVEEALQSHEGHILVFLPGVADIINVQEQLSKIALNNVLIAPLHASLPTQQQQLALKLPNEDMRKIVLATNIAETSLTIDGVSVVIDSGLEKVQKFNITRGASTLVEQHISKASSIQRAGRAGRQQAGVCYRLWDEEKQQVLTQASKPQITEVDISRELLMLLEWGSSFDDLPLIDKPSQAQVCASFNLLQALGFLQNDRVINALGKQAAQFNAHPRLAKLLLLAKTDYAQHAYLIAIMVSILEGKSLYKEANSIELEVQIQYLQQNKQHPLYKDIKRWAKQLRTANKVLDLSALPQILLAVYPDCLAIQRTKGQYILANGSGTEFHSYERERYEHLNELFCLDVNLNTRNLSNAQIRLFNGIPQALLTQHIKNTASNETQVRWDANKEKVSCRSVRKLGAIVLKEQAMETINSESVAQLLVKQIAQRGLSFFSPQVLSLINRINLAAKVSPELHLEALEMKTLFANWQSWLAPYLHNIFSLKQAQQLDWVNILKSSLSWEQQKALDIQFPIYFVSPLGNKHMLQYHAQLGVTLAIRLQELYGIEHNITVGQNKLAVTLSLLSPAQREIQKTQDLVGFWRGSYKEVQKDMKGRYPKHFWPDNPASSKPTTKTKKRM